MIHFKDSANLAALSYAAIQSDPVYEPEQAETSEYTPWDYIRDAVQVGLFFAAGVCVGTLLSILVVVGR